MSALLPINATAQERALSESVSRIGSISVPIASLWNPQTCPENLLPWLAWAFSVDEWDSTLTTQQKRNVIAASVEVHRHKGTIGSLKAALRPIGFNVDVTEQVSGPYTFKLKVDFESEAIDDTVLQRATRIAMRTKNVRSWLVGVSGLRKNTLGVYFASALLLGDEATINPYFLLNRDSELGKIVWAMAIQSVETASVYPFASNQSRLIESGNFRLLEDGFKRLLEN